MVVHQRQRFPNLFKSNDSPEERDEFPDIAVSGRGALGRVLPYTGCPLPSPSPSPCSAIAVLILTLCLRAGGSLILPGDQRVTGRGEAPLQKRQEVEGEVSV